jgi:hypothetical protein
MITLKFVNDFTRQFPSSPCLQIIWNHSAVSVFTMQEHELIEIVSSPVVLVTKNFGHRKGRQSRIILRLVKTVSYQLRAVNGQDWNILEAMLEQTTTALPESMESGCMCR